MRKEPFYKEWLLDIRIGLNCKGENSSFEHIEIVYHGKAVMFRQ